MPSSFVPPNGFAGFAQQTSAVQSLYRGKRGGSRRRKKKAVGAVGRGKKKAVRRRASTKGSSARAGRARRTRGGGRFAKGSLAAKRHMAKLRKMRKR